MRVRHREVESAAIPRASRKPPPLYHCPSSLPGGPPPPATNKCGHRAVECAWNTCVLCVCCPLAILLCVVKAPCKVALAAAQRCFPGGRLRRRRIMEASSSFSDHEYDWRPPTEFGRKGY